MGWQGFFSRLKERSTRPKRSTANRDIALDALRTFAVLGMIATHSTRLIPREARWELHRWAMLLEPLIPSLFLALAGASLVVSRGSALASGRQTAKEWSLRQMKRAFALWVVGVIFYLCEDGYRWPDALAAPGILGTIAYAVILLTGLLALPRAWAWMLAFLIAGSAIYQVLDARGWAVFAFNSGNSPFFPLLLFALAGALYASAGLKWKAMRDVSSWLPYLVSYLLLASCAGIAAWLISRYGLEALFSKPLGRSDATRLFHVTREGLTKTVAVGYYNLRPLLSLAVLGLLISLHQLLRLAQAGLRPFAPWLLAMGRHSLGVYILHLSLLAAAVLLGGKHPFPTAWTGIAVYCGLLLICEAYALARERF